MRKSHQTDTSGHRVKWEALQGTSLQKQMLLELNAVTANITETRLSFHHKINPIFITLNIKLVRVNYSPLINYYLQILVFILVITRLAWWLKTISFQRSIFQELNKGSNTCLFMVPYFCFSSFMQIFSFFPRVIHIHFLLKYYLCLHDIVNINKTYLNVPFSKQFVWSQYGCEIPFKHF